jgi:hypothetical protein
MISIFLFFLLVWSFYYFVGSVKREDNMLLIYILFILVTTGNFLLLEEEIILVLIVLLFLDASSGVIREVIWNTLENKGIILEYVFNQYLNYKIVSLNKLLQMYFLRKDNRNNLLMLYAIYQIGLLDKLLKFSIIENLMLRLWKEKEVVLNEIVYLRMLKEGEYLCDYSFGEIYFFSIIDNDNELIKNLQEVIKEIDDYFQLELEIITPIIGIESIDSK